MSRFILAALTLCAVGWHVLCYRAQNDPNCEDPFGDDEE